MMHSDMPKLLVCLNLVRHQIACDVSDEHVLSIHMVVSHTAAVRQAKLCEG